MATEITIKFPELTDKERFLLAAEQVLNEHIVAIKELAREGDDD